MTMQTPRKSLSAILDNASDCGVTNESILRDTTPRKQSTNAFLQFDDDSMTPPPVAQRTEQPAEVNFTEDKQALTDEKDGEIVSTEETKGEESPAVETNEGPVSEKKQNEHEEQKVDS